MRRTDREITDRAELIDIMEKSDTCHLALVFDGKPYAVALNYGFSWDYTQEGTTPIIYFHGANAGKKLDIIRKNGVAAFFIDTDHELVRADHDCNWSMKYRSVAGSGIISIVEDLAEKKFGLDRVMSHYSGRTEFSYDEAVFARTVTLKLIVTDISGKKKN